MSEITKLSYTELKEEAKKLEIQGYSRMKKDELIAAIAAGSGVHSDPASTMQSNQIPGANSETVPDVQPEMELKKYRGPLNHVIGTNQIQFCNGFYSTDDPAKQKLIESDMLYGTKICQI